MNLRHVRNARTTCLTVNIKVLESRYNGCCFLIVILESNLVVIYRHLEKKKNSSDIRIRDEERKGGGEENFRTNPLDHYREHYVLKMHNDTLNDASVLGANRERANGG